MQSDKTESLRIFASTDLGATGAGDPTQSIGAASLQVTQRMHLFRNALVALQPFTEQARPPLIGSARNTWDDVQNMVFFSMLGCYVENAIVAEPVEMLPPYSCVMGNYQTRSFLSAHHLRQAGMVNAFFALETVEELYDTAIFLELDAALRPTEQAISCRLAETTFELALRTNGGLTYSEIVSYPASEDGHSA